MTHATPTTTCAVCDAPQLPDGLTHSRGVWFCSTHLPLPTPSCGCRRQDAYSHTQAAGFICRHGREV